MAEERKRGRKSRSGLVPLGSPKASERFAEDQLIVTSKKSSVDEAKSWQEREGRNLLIRGRLCVCVCVREWQLEASFRAAANELLARRRREEKKTEHTAVERHRCARRAKVLTRNELEGRERETKSRKRATRDDEDF